MKRKQIIIALITAFFIAGCSPALMGGGKHYKYLQKNVDTYLHNIYFTGSSWSIMAVDLQSGRVLLNRDAERSLIPASNMKLLTSACALETLGPDYRFETIIGYTGKIDSAGTLNGDLIIIGEGDPTPATRYGHIFSSNPQIDAKDIFTSCADEAAKKGIHTIAGDIKGYSAHYSRDKHGSGWEWNDLKQWYAAEISPLIYTDDCIEVTISPGDSAGVAASIDWSPDFDDLAFYGRVNTSSSDDDPSIHFDRGLVNNIVTVWGTIPAGSEPVKRWIAVNDALAYFLEAMYNSLEESGISITGSPIATHRQWKSGDDLNSLFIHSSPPLNQIIRVINTDSQNLYAETLLRALGSEFILSGLQPALTVKDAFEAGAFAVETWEEKMAGKSPGFVMADGSGMSRRNMLSAAGIMKVLVHMNNSQYRGDFIRSLATPGKGTLRNRLYNLPTEISVFAKTGRMSRVRSLSGYIGNENGMRIAFSMICNNYLCESSEVEATMDNICQLLALYEMSGK